MILLKTDDLYFNTQIYFRKHYMDDLPNDDNIWRIEYHKWLKTQGAVILGPVRSCVKNSLGVSPGYDQFAFENESDATLFVLRWS